MNLSEFTYYSTRYNELTNAFFSKLGRKSPQLGFEEAKEFNNQQREEVVKGLDTTVRNRFDGMIQKYVLLEDHEIVDNLLDKRSKHGFQLLNEFEDFINHLNVRLD
jgi:hypothetical protein